MQVQKEQGTLLNDSTLRLPGVTLKKLPDPVVNLTQTVQKAIGTWVDAEGNRMTLNEDMTASHSLYNPYGNATWQTTGEGEVQVPHHRKGVPRASAALHLRRRRPRLLPRPPRQPEVRKAKLTERLPSQRPTASPPHASAVNGRARIGNTHRRSKKAPESLARAKFSLPLHSLSGAKAKQNTVAVVQLVRASDCGSECRGFESHLPPQEMNR